ncbi:MAG: sensor histidine kinase [Lachnospiraceae bacterium]|nr:sensor histidine kinase [Lachnospiraceae bacterium]
MANEQSALELMYQQIVEERDEVKKNLDYNLAQIKEIEEYLVQIVEGEDSGFKVFSPRNAETIYKEEIENSKTKKRQLEIENQSHYKRLNQLEFYITGLSPLVDDECKKTVALDSYDLGVNLKVLDIQEKERQRIARDLHDTSLQNLAHLVHKIELSSLFIDQDPLRAKLELASINKNLREVIDEIRETIFDLRPMSFDDLGLKESFERLFFKLKQSNTSIDISYDIEDIKCNNDLILMTIFRVVQECCSNAIKHSGGNLLSVSMKQKEDYYEISIEDNGVGFDIEETKHMKQNHFGLKVMKERVELLGGKVLMKSIKGQGTKVIFEIPNESLERDTEDEY